MKENKTPVHVRAFLRLILTEKELKTFYLKNKTIIAFFSCFVHSKAYLVRRKKCLKKMFKKNKTNKKTTKKKQKQKKTFCLESTMLPFRLYLSVPMTVTFLNIFSFIYFRCYISTFCVI